MKISAVYVDHARQRVNLEASENGSYLCCYFCPRTLADHVRAMIGDPPGMPSLAVMYERTRVDGPLIGTPWEDPRETYKKEAAGIVAKLASYQMRGIEVPHEAARAMLGMKEWRA